MEFDPQETCTAAVGRDGVLKYVLPYVNYKVYMYTINYLQWLLTFPFQKEKCQIGSLFSLCGEQLVPMVVCPCGWWPGSWFLWLVWHGMGLLLWVVKHNPYQLSICFHWYIYCWCLPNLVSIFSLFSFCFFSVAVCVCHVRCSGHLYCPFYLLPSCVYVYLCVCASVCVCVCVCVCMREKKRGRGGARWLIAVNDRECFRLP